MNIKNVSTKKSLERLTRKINWGIAGMGNFAENTVLPTLAQLKRSKVVSVYSHESKRAETIGKKYLAAHYFSDYEKFLQSGVDVVYVASANPDHYWQTIEALKAGKHVLCEKPMAMNSSEAEEMVRTAEENGVFLSVNYVYRFHPLIRKAKELVEKGFVGQIVSVSADFNIDFAPADNYRYFKEKGGGPFRDLGTHMIDVLRFLNGEISKIIGVKDNVVYHGDVEDFAMGIVKYVRGGYGSFNVSFNASKAPNRIVIQGSKGYISIENVVAKKMASSKLIIDIEGETRKTFRRRANKMLIRLREFQKSLLRNEEPEVSGEDGLINLRLIEEFEAQCL
jgi:glucose-fructose oxidoreductase